jgi:hypothetical protein
MDGEACAQVEWEVMAHRPIFTTTHRAKAFLVSRIVEQAMREGTPLTDQESNLLYFTEVEPATTIGLGDLEFDDADYERKITGLLRRRFQHECTLPNGGESRSFEDALELLSTQDHYLVVMAAPALKRSAIRTFSATTLNKQEAVLVVVCLAAFIVLAAWIVGRYLR